MIFNTHSMLEGQHAFLGASKYHWINYDDDKLDLVYRNWQAAQKGTELHAIANLLIRHGIKQARTAKAFNMYVNDAIGFRMNTEQTLFYSPNCFGTADAISFRNNLLRIHDYKSGAVPASPHQLEVYEALFCLEYGMKPMNIQSELRIYQDDGVTSYVPDPDFITHIMDKIITFDLRIEKLKTGV